MQKGAYKGKYIVIEGGEGCGKGTQTELALNYLISKNVAVQRVREPGTTPCGEKIRDILLALKDDPSITPVTEVLLFNAARASLMETVIIPALDRGETILADRSYISTIAYQEEGRLIPRTPVRRACEIALNGLRPSLAVILDIDPYVAHARKNSEQDRIEQLGIYFHQRVREGYLRYARNHKNFCRIIDATSELEIVFAEIKKHLDELYEFK